MKLFLKRSRGSITVLVTLILVPTIFFTGFLVDLSRLKLYGNQAVMTADNYGETVLSLYDNLLKELYGLFAVTQDQEALQELEELQGYMKSAFAPSENTITWAHLQAVLGETSYEGFMPYRSAAVSLEYQFAEGANLRSNEVLGTQIGDFMKFRIAQQLFGDGSDVLEALETVQNMEDNAKAIDKKMELDEEAEKLFQAAQEYYLVLKDFEQYLPYLSEINQTYGRCKQDFNGIVASDSYKIYKKYITSNQEAMTAAVQKRNRIAEAASATPVPPAPGATPAPTPTPETLSEAEQALVDIYDDYMEDEDARRNVLKNQFDRASLQIEGSVAGEPINFGNFEGKLNQLLEKAEKIERNGRKLETLRAQLRELLNGGKVSDKLKEGIQEELDRMDALFAQIDDYRAIADYIRENNLSLNQDYQRQVGEIVDRMDEIRDAYLDCDEEIPAWIANLDGNRYANYHNIARYDKLYQELKKCFGQEGEEDEGKKKKKDAENLSREAADELKQEEETTARDIPESFGYGETGGGGAFDMSDMVKEAVGYFSVNNFANELNKLVLKLYTVEYDFGMFTSRTTNVKQNADEETAVSLTGYQKARDINYLYQAELEYILGGANSSKDNLEAARNKILAFRAVVNFTATYSIDEVNTMIQSISDAAAAVNPILGLVVNGALRLAVAGVETAMDWKELKAGEGVVLIKTELKQLTAYDKIKGLLGLTEEKGEDDSFKMNYDQYLLVMLVFLTSFDEITERTANLIELNVNAVQQEIGSDGELSELQFKMEDAHTAVDASCTVHLDFVIMPKGFAKSVATDEAYSSLEEFEKNSYQFTVTRGY